MDNDLNGLDCLFRPCGAHLMIGSWILALLLMIGLLISPLHDLCKLSNGLDLDDLALEWFRLMDLALWAHLRP